MHIQFLSVFMVVGLLLSNASPLLRAVDAPTGLSAATRDGLIEYDHLKIQALEEQIKALTEKGKFGESEQAQLRAQVEALKARVAEMSAIHDKIVSTARGDSDVRKKLEAALSENQSTVEIQVGTLDQTLEPFKATTAIGLHVKYGKMVLIEVEGQLDGKHLPLANKQLKVYEQFKDGELIERATVITDRRGFAEWWFDPHTMERGTYCVAKFAGDPGNKPRTWRLQIR